MNRRRIATFVTLGLAAAALTACETSRLEQVRANPTPELDTLHQRPVDIDNRITVTFDENGRMFWQDLGRLMLFDRSSRLTPEPIPR